LRIRARGMSQDLHQRIALPSTKQCVSEAHAGARAKILTHVHTHATNVIIKYAHPQHTIGKSYACQASIIFDNYFKATQILFIEVKRENFLKKV